MEVHTGVLEAVFRQIREGVFITSVDRKVVYANDRLCEMTGYSPQEIIGRHISDFTSTGQTHFSAEATEQVMRGERLEAEIPGRTRDGLFRMFRARVSAWQEKPGEVSGLLYTVEDITQENERQRMLRETASTARLGGWESEVGRPETNAWTEETFRILDVNPPTPLSLAETLELFDADSQQKIRDAIALLLKEGSPFDMEAQLTTLAGRNRWVRIMGCLETIGDNRRRIRGTIQDITERKTQELILESVFSATAIRTGQDFFERLVLELQQRLMARYAFVGVLDGPDKIHTLAVAHNGELQPNFSYYLEYTPCANVVGKEPCVYPSAVQRAFPNDYLLAEMQVESYLGAPLFSYDGSPTGLLVVMDDKPMSDAVLSLRLLQAFSGRAGSEFDRMRAQRLAEASRAEAVNFRQALWESALILSLNEKFLITEVNAKFCIASGFDAAELLGQHASVLQSGQHSEEFYAEMAEAMQAGRYWRGDICNRTKSGGELWTDALIAPFNNPDGTARYLTIQYEITERKRSESRNERLLQELTASQTSLLLALEGANMVTWIWDSATDSVRWSENFREFFSLKENAELSVAGYESFLTLEDLQKTTAAIESVLSGFSPDFEIEHELLLPDHRKIWALDRGTAIRDANGHLTGMAGSIIDLTRLRHSEAELSRQSRILDVAQEVAHVGGWEADVTTGEVHWTKEMFAIHGLPGCTAVTLEKQPELVAPEDRDRIAAAGELAITKGEPWDTQIRILMPDNSRKWIRSIGRAVREAGVTRKLFGTIQDITEQKNAELAQEALLERTRRQAAAIVRISTDPVIHSNDLRASVATLSQIARQTIGVSRMSVWFLAESGSVLELQYMDNQGQDVYDQAELKAGDYPAYFSAIALERYVDAADAIRDSRTSEFARDYLQPNKIVSMLDATIRKDGKVIGVICAEATGDIRNWTSDEKTFMGIMADQITQLLIQRERRAAESERALLLDDLLEFSFMTSHNLRRPLTNILSLTDMLTQDDDPAFLSKALSMLHTSAEDLDRAIHEMNDRLNEKKWTLNRLFRQGPVRS